MFYCFWQGEPKAKHGCSIERSRGPPPIWENTVHQFRKNSRNTEWTVGESLVYNETPRCPHLANDWLPIQIQGALLLKTIDVRFLRLIGILVAVIKGTAGTSLMFNGNRVGHSMENHWLLVSAGILLWLKEGSIGARSLFNRKSREPLGRYPGGGRALGGRREV